MYSRTIVLMTIIMALLAAVLKLRSIPPHAKFLEPARLEQSAEAPHFYSRFVSSGETPHTHAPSLVELGDGRLRAFWFAGSREGSKDVEIHTAEFNTKLGRWQQGKPVASRRSVERALKRYIKKLGNPVVGRTSKGTLLLFFVTVSVGGWSGSSITMLTSTDDGQTWNNARRLITSPFLNLSTLVKGTPFLYEDGTVGLPIYHEFINKFGELLRLDETGRVIDKQRLSSGDFSCQPVVLVEGRDKALALMRYSSSDRPKRVISTSTEDGGQNWSAPKKTSLANPDSALTGVVLSDGRLLVALNNTEQTRDELSLVISSDGGATWKNVIQLEDQSAWRGATLNEGTYFSIAEALAKETDETICDAAPYAEAAIRQKCRMSRCEFEFSYPYMIRSKDGDFHLLYTWNRCFIKHVQFNQAWLEKQLSGGDRAESR
jgi:predicted neuraminidase